MNKKHIIVSVFPRGSSTIENCEDEYADYFTPYICEEDFALINFINGWVPNNQDAATELASYLKSNFPEDDSNNCAEVDFEALVTLMDLLEYNPYLLLDIDCNQITNWQTLAQHTAPAGIQNKIDYLPGNLFNDFYIQSLEDAGGTIVNMDYFPVKVTTLPNNPVTGQQFTADQFLDYFRRNINDFVDGSTFEPYCKIPSICSQETTLWNSGNPLGALIYIDIPGDDGTVVLTEYENDYWYFMTMNAPYSGNHPVAGTRQFGYEQNSDGSYSFFVRGVDRFDSNILENISYMASFFTDDPANPFFAADKLWKSFQTQMNQFVNSSGGSSTIVSPLTNNRPDWEKVEDVLKGYRPISDLGCN